MAESTIIMSKQALKLDGSLKPKAFTFLEKLTTCLLYTSPSPRDLSTSRMPSSA